MKFTGCELTEDNAERFITNCCLKTGLQESLTSITINHFKENEQLNSKLTDLANENFGVNVPPLIWDADKRGTETDLLESDKVTRNTRDNWRTHLIKRPLPENKVSELTLKLNTTYGGNLYFGVTNKYDEVNCDEKLVTTNYAWLLYIKEWRPMFNDSNGPIQYEEDTGYRNGSQVTIVVDRIQGSLSYRGKKADGQWKTFPPCFINESLKTGRLWFAASLYDNEDRILIVDESD